MNIKFNQTVQINCSVERVFSYLVNFPRHIEWAQTLDRMEQVRSGGVHGVGAQYRTYEKQAMQHNRKPGEKLKRGMPAITLCTVDEVVPNQLIKWHAHSVPKMLHNTLVFELGPDKNGGTLLTQKMDFHIPVVPAFFFRLMFGRDLQQKTTLQGEAGLKNIKMIMENGR